MPPFDPNQLVSALAPQDPRALEQARQAGVGALAQGTPNVPARQNPYQRGLGGLVDDVVGWRKRGGIAGSMGMPSLSDQWQTSNQAFTDATTNAERGAAIGGNPMMGFGNADLQGMGALAGMVRGWHGSRELFKKFSSDFIGTGEGAVAYGHGLYFADLKDIGTQYKNNLAGRADVIVGGQVMEPWSYTGRRGATLPGAMVPRTKGLPSAYEARNTDGVAVARLQNMRKQKPDAPTDELVEDAIADIDRSIEATARDAQLLKELLDEPPGTSQMAGFQRTGNTGARSEVHFKTFEALQGQKTALRRMQDQGLEITPPKAHLYEADLDIDGVTDMVQWDTPFADQPKVVKDALAEYQQTKKAPARYNDPGPYADKNMDYALREMLRSSQGAKLMHSKGLKGVRYLDGNSRAAGGGSYNYVIFDDSLIDIKSVK